MTRHRGALNAYYATKEANWLPAVGCQLWTFGKKKTGETGRSSVVVRGVGGGAGDKTGHRGLWGQRSYAEGPCGGGHMSLRICQHPENEQHRG